MRTASLAILAGILVYALPGTVSAQQYRSPMQNNVVCPPGQLMQNGVCVDRPRVGPRHHRDGNPGHGTGWVNGNFGYDQSMCQWSHFDQSYVFCPYDGSRNPPPK